MDLQEILRQQISARYRKLNPANVNGEELMTILQAFPEIAEEMFGNYGNWSVDEPVLAEMIELVKAIPQLKAVDDAEYAKLCRGGAYINCILAVNCHKNFERRHADEATNDYSWVLVVHEKDIGTIFDYKLGVGVIIQMSSHQYLLNLPNSYRVSDTGSRSLDFEHVIIYGVESDLDKVNQKV